MPQQMPSSINIGDAANASGISAKMIRHYEEVGLVQKARRTTAGYRLYTPEEIHVLRFIRHSRSLGFSMDEIAALLSLWRNKRRPSRTVRALAQAHIEDLDRKIVELQTMRASLSRLVDCCHGDDRPECPILDELSRADVPVAAVAPKKHASKKPAPKRVAPHGCR